TVVVPEGETAVCAVRARNAAGVEVGREEVRVDPPLGQRRPRVTRTLATTERPATGEVQRCWPDRQVPRPVTWRFGHRTHRGAGRAVPRGRRRGRYVATDL